jgi:hypothetical protein
MSESSITTDQETIKNCHGGRWSAGNGERCRGGLHASSESIFPQDGGLNEISWDEFFQTL